MTKLATGANHPQSAVPHKILQPCPAPVKKTPPGPRATTFGNTSDRASPTGPALHQDNGSKHRSAKSRKAREMFSSTMLAIFDSRPPSSRKEGRHQGQVHWLVCTQSPGLAHPSASHLRYQLTEIPDPIGDYCLHTRQTVQALSCVGKGPLGAKRKGGICSSGKTLPARKVRVSGVRCQVVVSAEENHSCPVYWAAPGGPGSRAKARDCFCFDMLYVLMASGH